MDQNSDSGSETQATYNKAVEAGGREVVEAGGKEMIAELEE